MQTNEEQKNESGPQPGGSQNEHKQIPVWEWIAAFVGLALVTAAIGFSLYDAIWGSDKPPAVRIEIASIEMVGSEYLVRYRAFNEGGTTASGLNIKAELKRGSDTTASTQVIDYLPVNSIREGGFFFKEDPRQFDLRIQAVSYHQP